MMNVPKVICCFSYAYILIRCITRGTPYTPAKIWASIILSPMLLGEGNYLLLSLKLMQLVVGPSPYSTCYMYDVRFQ
jgi:hypothetical protein